jgi:hypothetical protein
MSAEVSKKGENLLKVRRDLVSARWVLISLLNCRTRGAQKARRLYRHLLQSGRPDHRVHGRLTTFDINPVTVKSQNARPRR